MIIKTDAFKENRNLICHCKTNDSEISEGMYLDFKQSKVYIKNTITKYFISFPFQFVLDKDETIPENFLINSDQLLAITSGVDEIEYKNNSFFHNKNIFKIRVNTKIEFPSNDFSNDYENSVVISPKIMALLVKATNVFYQDKPEDKYKTAYYSNGYVYSLNNFRGYIVKADDSDLKIDFHTTFIDLIRCINTKEFTLYYDEKINNRKLETPSGTIIYAPVSRYNIPDLGEKIFTFINGENKTVVNRDTVLSTLNTIKSLFDSKDLEKKIDISVKGSEVIFELKDSINPYVKLVTENIENNEDCTKTVDYENVNKIIKLIDGENVELKISEDLPLLIIKSLVPDTFEVSLLSVPKKVKV